MSLIKIVNKDFDLPDQITERELRELLIDVFADLIEHNFSKLIQVLYKADVDQYKLKELLENTDGKSSAEIITDVYISRQMAKIETWKKYSQS